MPSYDVKCNSCDKEFEEFTSIDARMDIKCTCGGATTQVFNHGRSPKPVIFREGVYDHIGPNPIHISSKKQLLDECKKNGVYSNYYG